MAVLKIGLTGGIGSGKSTVAELFAKLGVPVIDADKIARDVIAQDARVFQEIVAHFGNAVLDAGGALNRYYLRDVVFSDPTERRWLEALLHPLILAEIKRQVRLVTQPYCLLVIPLLIEATSPYSLVDRVLVVDVPREVQIARTMQRDKMTADAVETILQSQASRERRLQIADDVIHNDGDIAQLTQAVNQLHQRYLAMKSAG